MLNDQFYRQRDANKRATAEESQKCLSRHWPARDEKLLIEAPNDARRHDPCHLRG